MEGMHEKSELLINSKDGQNDKDGARRLFYCKKKAAYGLATFLRKVSIMKTKENRMKLFLLRFISDILHEKHKRRKYTKPKQSKETKTYPKSPVWRFSIPL